MNKTMKLKKKTLKKNDQENRNRTIIWSRNKRGRWFWNSCVFKKTKILMTQFWSDEQSKNITGILPFSSDVEWSFKNFFYRNQKKIIDCTFGGGGYSKEILKFPNTIVQAIDRDKKALFLAKELEKKFPQRFKFYQIKFSQLNTISNDKVDTIIFDLGLSSIQLNDLDRGFSFNSKKN